MKYKILFFMLLLFFNFNSNTFAIFAPEGKITFRIVDEQGKSIEGVNASAGFRFPDIQQGGITGTRSETLTSSDGLLVASGRTMDQVGYSAKKSGYYISKGIYRFNDNKSDRWLPWNPTVEILLRKIENPVPMYARNTRYTNLKIPGTGKEVGFDLIEHDWTPPYGKGKITDFIFKFDNRYTKSNDFNSTLTIKFINKYDGIQYYAEDRKGGSLFKLPRFAPLSGYQKEWSKSIKGVPGKPWALGLKDDNNYFFRVRSEVEDGKLKRAMYGKIQGNIRIMPDGLLMFVYYLNPDYTRNMEYGKNLFKIERRVEKVFIDTAN